MPCSDIWSISLVMFSWKFNLVARRKRVWTSILSRSACDVGRLTTRTFSAARKLLRRLPRPPGDKGARSAVCRGRSVKVQGPSEASHTALPGPGSAVARPTLLLCAVPREGGGSYWIPALGRGVDAWWMVETVADVIPRGAGVAPGEKMDGSPGLAGTVPLVDPQITATGARSTIATANRPRQSDENGLPSSASRRDPRPTTRTDSYWRYVAD